MDKLQIFAEPVNTKEVPDYLSIIKSPMDFATMNQKIENHEYQNMLSFEVFY